MYLNNNGLEAHMSHLAGTGWINQRVGAADMHIKTVEQELMRCSRCIYDETIEGISFDEHGICNYCHQIDSLKAQFLEAPDAGSAGLLKIIEQVKLAGRGNRYDCIVGVSGGTDSSYLLMKAVDWGLRPLAVHYDNTWNTATATQNIAVVTRRLGVDLQTHVVDNRVVDNIKLAFLRSGVREFDADTDIAFVQVLRQAAAQHGVKHILEGHSFLAEGLTPVGANYLDGQYVASVHDRFGDGNRATFPNMLFWDFMKWALVYRQKFIRPLWYLDYRKEPAQEELAARMGWVNYGGHHLENRASSFAHSVWLPQRFDIDYRNLTLAAKVRRGDADRDQAIAQYRTRPEADPRLIKYVKNRLWLSDDDYEKLMIGPKRTWREFDTYKRRFERLRPAFYLMARAQLVPMSFYIKYCRRSC